MEDFFLNLTSSQGIWSALSVVLIFYIIRTQDKRDQKQTEREENYQKIIQDLTDKLAIVADIKEGVDKLQKDQSPTV